MTQITRLPGSLNIRAGVGDALTIAAQIQIGGQPADITAWTLTGENCTVTVTDAAQGEITLSFQSGVATLQRWSLTRTSAPERRLVAGFLEFLLDAGDSTATALTINITDDSVTVEINIAPGAPGLEPGGADGSLLERDSTTGSGTAWTQSPRAKRVRFDTANALPLDAAGDLAWDDLDQALAYRTNGLTIDIAQESVVYVRNPPGGSTISKGAAVAVAGASSNRLRVQLCDATAGANLGCRTLGVAMTAIPSPGFGFVSTFGLLRGFDTGTIIGGGVTEGSELFISSTPGVLSTQPQASPGRRVTVGYVVTTGANGSIFVTVRRGVSFNEVDDVDVTGAAQGDLLYRAATRWERIPAGNEGDVLAMVGGVPTWVPGYLIWQS